jgi:hypothetical protein
MRKGSIREKSKPIISLKNLSEKGIIVIPKAEYKIADPVPNSWVMIKPGDIIISASGTIRLILKKNWQEGEVESLRITWEAHDERLEASLEVEKMEIDSSNFDYLNIALRPFFTNEIPPHEYKPDFFTRAVRYNILTFLGFGKIGYAIHKLMPTKGDKRAPPKFSLVFILDTANNILIDVYPANSSEENRQKKINCVEIAVLWKRLDKIKSYQISDIAYPPGVSASTLETITLASEIANAFSLANEIHSSR